MKYKCIARISYEVEIEADSAEEAEVYAFEMLADDVTQGVIRTDLFADTRGAEFNFPMMDGVEVEEIQD